MNSLLQIRSARFRWPLLMAIVVWLVFTVSLTIWWIVFGFSQLERIVTLDHTLAPDLIRHQKMLLWEGITLIASLLIGGGALTIFVLREIRTWRNIRDFFAAFSHDIKTPLAAIQLDAEALSEKTKEGPLHSIGRRLGGETRRLVLRLENALIVALQGKDTTHREVINLVEFIDESFVGAWPEVHIRVEGEGKLLGDKRYLWLLFSNILQNAVKHGKATEIVIALRSEQDDKKDLSLIRVTDNGLGNVQKTHTAEKRKITTSSHGLGQWVIARLAKHFELNAQWGDRDDGQAGYQVILQRSPLGRGCQFEMRSLCESRAAQKGCGP